MDLITNNTALFSAYDDYQSLQSKMPERELMVAVLRSAIDDYLADGREKRNAIHYLLNNDSYYVFSFVSICTYLEICPHLLRVRLGLVPPTLSFFPRIIDVHPLARR